MAEDTALLAIRRGRIALTKAHTSDTRRSPVSVVTGFRWVVADPARLQRAVGRLYDRHPPAFDKLVNKHLRPSGACQRFVGGSNRAL